MKKTLSVDFDGVLHSYASGWQGPGVATDEPVPGAIEWLTEATQHFKVAIFSSRSHQFHGIEAMQDWLRQHELPEAVLAQIDFPDHKPIAFVTLDDRAIRFTGTFPTVEELESFRPWDRRDV